jgi:hypothetical protein
MDFTPFWHLRYLEKTLCIGTSTVRSLDNFNKLLAIPDTNSIRRKMDISYVLLSFAYQIQISKNAEYANYYWVIMSVVIFFFPLGHFLNNHNAWDLLSRTDTRWGQYGKYSVIFQLYITAQLTP